MSNYILEKQSPLDGFEKKYEGFKLAEIKDKSLVMIAIPENKKTQIASAIKDSSGLTIPEMTKSTKSSDGTITLWRLQKNQVFAYYDYENHNAEESIKERLKAEDAYYTDQSDTWAIIHLSGQRSNEALERICPINLDPKVFTKGNVVRTSMEHIASIVYKEDENSYLILVMRSFAKSMLHALEVSIENVL